MSKVLNKTPEENNYERLKVEVMQLRERSLNKG
jgi:hypothetical protein